MKTMRFICFFIPAFLFSSCDPEFCAEYKIINTTEHKISLFTYKSGNLDSMESIDNLRANDSFVLGYNYCQKGWAGRAFQGSDSVILYFNDTLRAVLFKIPYYVYGALYGEMNPVFPPAWIKTGTKKWKPRAKGGLHKFEFEFTDWHYQEALRAHGYAVE